MLSLSSRCCCPVGCLSLSLSLPLADFGVERSVDTSSLKPEDVEKRFLALLSHATNLPRSDESKESKKIA